MINLSRITKNPNNPRIRKDEAFQRLVASVQKFPQMFVKRPIVIDSWENPVVLGGNQRLEALKAAGFKEVPNDWIQTAEDWTEEQKREFVVKDNTHAGEWDFAQLAADYDLEDLRDFGVDMPDVSIRETSPKGDEEGPEVFSTEIHPGDFFEIGPHRLYCADSTDREAVARIFSGAEPSSLLHADPPYGMGKESDGVANDNLYGAKLDAFQMQWLHAWRPFALHNASLYIWGNPLDLWRLYFTGGLSTLEALTYCNHIVWDKKSIAGMKSPDLTNYPIASEHCLFFQFGEQHFGNVNQDAFWEGWEPVRSYLSDQATAAQITPKLLKEITGVQMFSHWFSRSQWTLIPERHYLKLRETFPGLFLREYEDLRALHLAAQKEYRAFVDGSRSFFDNAHDIMRDVWEFDRVVGEERHGHATPKPVAMIERIVKSSSKPNDIVAEPFGGSGTTMVAAHKTGRRCFMFEIEPLHCQRIVNRMRRLEPSLQITRNGEPFNL